MITTIYYKDTLGNVNNYDTVPPTEVATPERLFNNWGKVEIVGKIDPDKIQSTLEKITRSEHKLAVKYRYSESNQ